MLTPEWSGREIEVKGPCVMTFFVPSYSLITENTVYFKCDKTAQSPLLTYPNLTNPLTSNVYTISLPETENGYSGVITLLKGNLKITPYLEELFIEFYEPGICIFDIHAGLTNLVNNAAPVVLESEILIETSDDVLLLMRNNLIEQSSCYFTWTGYSSARIYLSTTSEDFTPSDTSTWVSAYYDLELNTPLQFIDNLKSFTQFWLLAKIVSDNPGTLHIQAVLPPPEGVVLLEYGKPVSLQANDDRVFFFPKGWKSTEFVASTNYVMHMYASNTSEFAPSADDANVLANYSFLLNGVNRSLQLSNKDVTTLFASATDDYIYVRFQCNTATTLTPLVWTPSSCANQSILLCSGEEISVPKASKDVLYRLRYEDWQGYDLSITWNNRSRPVPVYFASVCDFTLSSTAPNVVYYKSCKYSTSAPNIITIDIINSWADQVDEYGFLYVRMNPQGGGQVKLLSLLSNLRRKIQKLVPTSD